MSFDFYSVYSPFFFFFFNDTATTEIYTLSLHDALPIYAARRPTLALCVAPRRRTRSRRVDRKSTRLNSSHSSISYAVFCLKKKTPIATPATLRQKRTVRRHMLIRIKIIYAGNKNSNDPRNVRRIQNGNRSGAARGCIFCCT